LLWYYTRYEVYVQYSIYVCKTCDCEVRNCFQPFSSSRFAPNFWDALLSYTGRTLLIDLLCFAMAMCCQLVRELVLVLIYPYYYLELFL
jgi:hypothetical protein